MLIVEDDRLNVRILTGILKPEGHEIADVGSVEAALERYPQFKPGLVFFGVMMPGISGQEKRYVLWNGTNAARRSSLL